MYHERQSTNKRRIFAILSLVIRGALIIGILVMIATACSSQRKAVVVGVNVVLLDGKVYHQQLDNSNCLYEKVPFRPTHLVEESPTTLEEIMSLQAQK